MGTPQSRLELFIKEVFGKKKAFADYLKVHPTWVTAYTKEKDGSVIKDHEIVEKLSIKGLNYQWYLTGEGEMITTQYKYSEEQSRKENAEVNAYVDFKKMKDLHKLSPEQIKDMIENLPEFFEKIKKLDKVYEEIS